MKIRLDARRDESLLDQARDQILSALHAGLVRRGDRLPSLRQVATLSRLNVKTVMRVYTLLRNEGLVDLRRGSGAFVGAQDPAEMEPDQATKLSRLLRRHLDEASGLNITPGAYAAMIQRLVNRGALKSRTVAVLECNEEQVRLFAREIQVRTGVRAHPILLSRLASRDAAAAALVRGSSLLAVTDFHRVEGDEIARRFGKLLVRLRLRRDYVPSLMEAARYGRLAMIVSDAGFFPAFKRTLGVLGLHKEDLDRISVAAGDDLPGVRRALARADSVYVSPLCERAVRKMIPRGPRLLTFGHHLAAESVETLEACLLLAGAEPADGSLPP
jgi:GntR family transcriptional regulator